MRREGRLDALAVEVEALTDVPAETYPALAHDVAHHIKSLVGVTAEILVKQPGEIPRSQGKAVRVRDLRPKET